MGPLAAAAAASPKTCELDPLSTPIPDPLSQKLGMEPEVPAVESEAAPVSETASPWARPPPDCRASMQPRLPQGQGMGPPGRPASHRAGGSRKGRGSQFQPALHRVSPIPMRNRFIATRGRNRKDQFQSEPPVLKKATASQGPGLSCPVFWASAFTSCSLEPWETPF